MKTANVETINKADRCLGCCNRRYLKIAARIFLSALFVIIGFTKLMNFAGTAAFIGAAGLPIPQVFTALAIIFELGGGLMLLFGFNKRIAVSMLIIFTVLSTALFHIKNLTTDQLQMIMFLKNLAIVGGLMALYGGCGSCHGGSHKCKEGGEGCKNCDEKPRWLVIKLIETLKIWRKKPF